jgi:phasin family protein
MKGGLFSISSLKCCIATKITCEAPQHPYNSIHAALQHKPVRPGFRRRYLSTSPHLTSIGDLYMLTVEQVLATQKANVETFMGLTTKAFEGVEKIVELNLTASKAALAESAEHAKALLSVKDAQELMALQSGVFQPLAEKTAAYNRHLYDIASGSTAELTKVFEGQAADTQKKFMGLVDSAAKNAPAGSETAVAVMKSAVAAANNALESVQKAVKQATDAAEANMNAVATTAVEATKPVAKKR